jgi:hypothetical protein
VANLPIDIREISSVNVEAILHYLAQYSWLAWLSLINQVNNGVMAAMKMAGEIITQWQLYGEASAWHARICERRIS